MDTFAVFHETFVFFCINMASLQYTAQTYKVDALQRLALMFRAIRLQITAAMKFTGTSSTKERY